MLGIYTMITWILSSMVPQVLDVIVVFLCVHNILHISLREACLHLKLPFGLCSIN